MIKSELIKLFEKEFKISEISDYSLNGLQVDNSRAECKKIAFAVDACVESVNRAAAIGADMLFVHHGLFWGKCVAITKEYYKRIKALIDNDIALFAVHLPLDLNSLYGNNIQICKKLGLSNIESFGFYNGRKIGFKGELSTPLSCRDVCDKLGFEQDSALKILQFGVKQNKSVAIISGGAAKDITQAIDENIDLYITGECEHSVYHTVEENNINMIAAGHYRTETFGVRAVCDWVKTLGIEGEFIDIDTGM